MGVNKVYKNLLRTSVSAAAANSREFVPPIIEILDLLGVARSASSIIIHIAPSTFSNWAACRAPIPSRHFQSLLTLSREALVNAKSVTAKEAIK